MGRPRIYTDEERKQKDLDRLKRWEERNPEKAAAMSRASSRRWQINNRAHYNAYKREYMAEVRRVRKALERGEAV